MNQIDNPEQEVEIIIKQSDDPDVIEIKSQQPDENIETIQPFQVCQKRDVWEQKYAQYFTIDIEEEKTKLLEKNRPPRKPLSPYIFFSQEKRKEIKAQKNLSAKQIMKMVSKHWQDVKDDKNITEKYEYLSLRDRELYSVLRKFWKQEKEDFPDKSNSQVQNWSMVLKSTRQRGGKNDVHLSDEQNCCVPNEEEAPKETETSVKLVPALEVIAETDVEIIGGEICTQEQILTKQTQIEQKRQSCSQVSEKEQSQNNEKMNNFVNKRQQKTLQKLLVTLKPRQRINSYNFNVLGDNLGYKIQKTVDRRNTFDITHELNNPLYLGQNIEQSDFLQENFIQNQQVDQCLNQKLLQGACDPQIHESKSQQDQKLEFQPQPEIQNLVMPPNLGSQKKDAQIDQNLFKGFDYNVQISNSSEQRRIEENFIKPHLQMQKRNSRSDANTFYQVANDNNYQPFNNKLNFELQAIPENFLQENDMIIPQQSIHSIEDESQEHQIEEPVNNNPINEKIKSVQDFMKQQNNQIGGLSASTQPKSYAIGDTIQKQQQQQQQLNQPQINTMQYLQPNILQQQFFIPNLGLGLQQTSINEFFPSGDEKYQDDLSPLNQIMYKQKSNLIDSDKLQNNENVDVEMITNNMLQNYNSQMSQQLQQYNGMYMASRLIDTTNLQQAADCHNLANNMQPSTNIISRSDNINIYNEPIEIEHKSINRDDQEPERPCKQAKKAPTGRGRGRPRKNKE